MNDPRECGNAGSRVRLVIDHDRLAMAGGKLDVARATLGAGAFTNYGDKILPIIDNLPTPCWHLGRNSFTEIRKILYTVDI